MEPDSLGAECFNLLRAKISRGELELSLDKTLKEGNWDGKYFTAVNLITPNPQCE